MKAVLRESGAQALPVTTDPGFLPAYHDQQASPIVALRVEGLSKRYGTTQAVAELSFDIAQGEVFGLLGPNGAGKTTTIAMLATQRRPCGGDAMLFGHSVRDEPSAVRQIIGLAPQEIALYPRLTAAENLQFFGRIYGVKGARLASRVDQLLSFVGLEAHRDNYVGTFSGGMQRRLNLAAALVHEPKLLLLDEPTAGVDPQARSHILELVGRLRAAGAAILYTTHYMEEAQQLCDRLGIMDQGKMVAMGTLDALLANSNCAEIIELHGVAPGTNFDALRSRPGLLRLESTDGQVRLHVKNAMSFLEPLQQVVNRSRKPVHLKISPPSLERLFLELTGREMRD
jgi:ABC-2 type transport system ATP-binding protein